MKFFFFKCIKYKVLKMPKFHSLINFFLLVNVIVSKFTEKHYYFCLFFNSNCLNYKYLANPSQKINKRLNICLWVKGQRKE